MSPTLLTPKYVAPWRRFLVAFAAIVFIVTLVAPTTTPAQAAPSEAISSVKAAPVVGFQAGNIMSDAVFFDSTTMSAGEIDAFLKGMVPSCRSGYVCLKDYRQSTPNRGADAYCNGYSGGQNESAATIIYKASVSCGINPQVILVMLEKEQSLVTHTWPSSWRYDMALGQGCPDTAPCDPAFSGFFYQIYGAARQMKIYAEGKYFTWYAPGKTWNIRYNPNVACGSSPVYIANKATAALYYYTPYQPNAAAIAAGYGEGDACSAYGNRNFYSFFTSWFGSTQVPQNSAGRSETAALVKGASTAPIYVAANGVKYHITTGEDFAVFAAKLGAVQIVSDSAVAALTSGPPATRLARDSSTGEMFLLQADGTKHYFTSPETVQAYGFTMAGFINYPTAQLALYATGAPVGNYFRADGSPDYYKYENASKRYITSQLAWSQESAAAGGYVAVIPAPTVNAMKAGPALLGAGTLVSEVGKPEVYIAGSGTELIYINSWGIAADAGLTRTLSVPAGTLNGFTKLGSLTPFLSCGGQTYIVGKGMISPVSRTTNTTPILQLSPGMCAAFPVSGTRLGEPIIVQTAGTAPLYTIEDGKLRHIRTGATLARLTAGQSPAYIVWSSGTSSTLQQGPAHLQDGAFVQFGDARIFYVEAGVVRHIQTMGAFNRLSGGTTPVIEQYRATDLVYFVVGQPIPN